MIYDKCIYMISGRYSIVLYISFIILRSNKLARAVHALSYLHACIDSSRYAISEAIVCSMSTCQTLPVALLAVLVASSYSSLSRSRIRLTAPSMVSALITCSQWMHICVSPLLQTKSSTCVLCLRCTRRARSRRKKNSHINAVSILANKVRIYLLAR